MTLEELLNKLEGVKKVGNSYMAYCPAHSDKHQSLSVKETNGRILLHCFAGCSLESILDALGLKVQDLYTNHKEKFTEDKTEDNEKRIVAVYDYTNETGQLLFQVVRYEPKDFRIRRFVDGRCVYNLGDVEPVLYKLPELIKSQQVFVAEGEKDADNLAKMGLTATTAPFGAGKWRANFNKYFIDKDVIIVPDFDEVGIQHSFKIEEQLKPIAKSVKILNPESLNLKEKGDISDWIESGGTKEQLLEILQEEKNFLSKEKWQKKKKEKETLKLLNTVIEEIYEPKAIDFHNGVLTYGTIWNSKKVLISSDYKVKEVENANFMCSNLTPEIAKRFLEKKEKVDGAGLVQELANFIGSHVFFTDANTPIFLGMWVIGTYLHPLFIYYGYLWITSPMKRCGKSLLLDILSCLCFNATPRLISPSSASLFRQVESDCNTVILDEMERIRTDDVETYHDIISLLNGGFQQNSVIPRVSKDRSHTIHYFRVYSPKVIAGINKVADTIEDRAFKIIMSRKKKNESVCRFNIVKEKKRIDELKARLYLFSLNFAEEISDVYHSATGEWKDIFSLDDRLQDISEPILSIASVIDEAFKSNFYDKTVEFILKKGRKRRDVEGENSVKAFLEILSSKLTAGENEIFVPTSELLRDVQNDENLKFITSGKRLSQFISNLSEDAPTPILKRGFGRGYHVKKEWLDEMMERY
ncbi:hypothetical protein [Thermodesulfovibrio sp. 3462-1]|uniref:DUF3631 domain-containing protein n=1 Tax=Thermodesulfovibrio obliviosus TaxID=3118332 RepID=A0AAU8H1J3_9BACT